MTKLIIVFVLSLLILVLIFWMTHWTIKTSASESKKFKGIPSHAYKWIKFQKILGYLSLLMFLILVYQPTQSFAGLFLSSMGLYFTVYGIAVHKAGRLEPIGFGIDYYGKAARFYAWFIALFGMLWLAAGVLGLLILD